MSRRFFGNFLWALAHAAVGVDGNGLWHGGGFDGGRHGIGCRGCLLPLTFPIASVLSASTLFAGFGSPIALRGVPATPTTRFVLAGRSAIALLRAAWEEPVFAPFEKTAAAVRMRPLRSPDQKGIGILTKPVAMAKVRMAHGR